MQHKARKAVVLFSQLEVFLFFEESVLFELISFVESVSLSFESGYASSIVVS